MFAALIIFLALVICYLTYEVYKENRNENAKRIALIASIEHLRKIELTSKPQKPRKRWRAKKKLVTSHVD